MRQARRQGLPVASGFHTNFDQYAGNYGVGWLKGPVLGVLRHFHNRTGATLVATASQAQTLSAQGFANVRVMSRGIDADYFSPDRRDSALRQSWRAGEHQPVALHVGRLASEKNLDLLVDSVQAMQQVQPDLITVLVGDDEAFIDHAVSLCQHPARYGQLGRQARQRVAAHGWDRIADDFLRILLSLKEISDDISHACHL